MGFTKDSFGINLDGIGAMMNSTAIDTIMEHESRMTQILEPPQVMTAFLEQEERMRTILEPPTVLTEMIEQENNLRSILSSPMIDAITAQQDYITKHELAFSKAIEASFQMPQLDFLAESLAKSAAFALPEHTYDLVTAMGRSLELCIPRHDEMAVNLSYALEASIPKLDIIGEVALRLADSIPKIDHAVISIAQQTMQMMDGITESMQRGLSALSDAFSHIDVSQLFDFSDRFNFIADFENKNETLKSFGWYLISELPEEIVDEIYERRDEITQEEVDTLIIQYFRSNKCHALKRIVNSWTALPYFESRKVIFHEAQVCHSRRSYNASTTLISLHYEGVVTDFVRDRINTPTYRVEKALKCINDLANDLTLDAMPFRDWIVCSYVLECVDQAFTTNFSPADPDNCPNNSRHKIAHGHATAKETEANSLRRFLFMNELYKLFCCLENEYQLVS